MKKCIILLLSFLLIPVSSIFADGGFLNVDINVYNQNGGSLQPKDISWKVTYDNGYEDILTGRVQAYGFPHHTTMDPLTYSVTPVLKSKGPESQYSVKLSTGTHLACSDTLDTNRLLLTNCTIYLTDDKTLIKEDVTPVEVQTPIIVTSTPAVEAQVQQIVDNSELIKALQKQLMELLNQLIILLSARLQAQAR